MRKTLKDIALVLGIVATLVTLIGFFSGQSSLPGLISGSKPTPVSSSVPTPTTSVSTVNDVRPNNLNPPFGARLICWWEFHSRVVRFCTEGWEFALKGGN